MRQPLIGLLAIISFLLAVPARAQSYTITNLGTLPGYSNSYGAAVSFEGAVAGFVRNGEADSPRPFRYTAGGGIQELGGAPLNGQAFGIDATGNVAGYFLNETSQQQAFLFRNSTVVGLGTLGGTESAALGLSPLGVPLGWARTASGARHAARFGVDGENNPLPVLDLGTLGGDESFAHGTNLFGDIVGQAQNVLGQFRPFLYRGGAIGEIPTLGGTEGAAFAVNNGTQVVGASRTAGNAALHAFLWQSLQGVVDLGTLGGAESVATGINNLAFVVGYSRLATGTETHAFLWHANLGMIDLNQLLPLNSGWVLLEARGINDAGQITGVGTFEGVKRAFLLTPPVADCSLGVAVAPSTVAKNENITLDIVVTNGGPNGAPLNRVTQSLPPDWELISVNMSQGTHALSGTNLHLNFGSLANAATATAQVVVKATTVGQFQLPALLRASKNDENLTNNSGFVSVTVTEPASSADLKLEFNPFPNPAGRNVDLTYAFAVTNNGPSPAIGVVFSLAMHTDVQFRSATLSQGSLEFVEGGPSPDPGFPESMDYALGALGIIESGQTVTGKVVVRYPQNGSFRYYVSATSINTDDPNTLDNTFTDLTTVITAPNASLSLTAQDSPDPVRVGQNLTYTFGITNQGPDAASDVRLDVDLPSGVTLVSTNAPKGTVSNAHGDVTFAIGSLANGATVQATVVVTPTVAGALSYSATVTSFSVDNDTSNNTQSGTTTAAPFANLGLTAADGPDPVGVGSDLTYTFDVTNVGPDAAPNARLDVDLPAGVQIVSTNTPQGQATVTNGDVAFTFGTLANGANLRATVVARLQSEGPAAYSATVSSDAIDSITTNNSRSGSTEAKFRADLGLTASDSPDPVLVNQNLTYTFNVNNAGPQTAKNVRLTVDLAAGVTIVSRNTPQGSSTVTNGDVVFSLGDIANGASVECMVVITSGQEGTLNYAATVATDAIDANSGNNTRSGSTAVNAVPIVADLGVTATDGPDPVNVGSPLTYTFQVTNAGPDTAKGARLEVDLPAGVTIVSQNVSQGTATVTGGDVLFTLGDIAANAPTVTATIVVTPGQTGGLNYSATVAANSTDPSSGNNTVSGSTTVNSAPLVADLSVAGSFNPTSAIINSEVTGTFTVTNAGPDVAANTQFALTLPVGVEVVSASTTQGTVAAVSGGVTGQLGVVASSGTVTVMVVLRPTQIGDQSLLASVTTSSSDPSSGNNSAPLTLSVLPVPPADLSVTVTDTPDPIQTGQNLTYTYTVTNHGPNTATGVVFEATIPTGTTLVSLQAPLGGATVVGGQVVSNIGTLGNGASTTITIVVEVNSGTALTATGAVDGDQEDANPANNLATASTTVQAVGRPDLKATWTIQPTQKGVKFRRTRMRYTVRGTLTVQNGGTVKTKPSSIWLYLSSTPTLDGAAKPFRKLPVGVLAPGRSQKKAITYVQPLDQSAAGKYLIAVLDATNKNPESSETNNRVISSPIP